MSLSINSCPRSNYAHDSDILCVTCGRPVHCSHLCPTGDFRARLHSHRIALALEGYRRRDQDLAFGEFFNEDLNVGAAGLGVWKLGLECVGPWDVIAS